MFILRNFLGAALLGAVVLAVTVLLPGREAWAEVGELRLSTQFGLSYLPILIIRNQHLIEKNAAAAGLPDLKVSFLQLNGGAVVNDALISGDLDFGAAGIAPALTLWDKTRGTLDVRIAAALDSLNLPLNTNNPAVKSLSDFTDQDRIAVPAVKVSIQSVLLQIAAERQFGPGQQERLDRLTVSLKHPDALVGLLSGGKGLTAHFAQQPYGLLELRNPHIHTVITSQDILGGPATLNVLYTTARFRVQNPRVYRAVLDALRQADELIAHDPATAAHIFVVEDQPGVPEELIRDIIADRRNGGFSVVPTGTEAIAAFLARIGALKNKPASWKDTVFPDLGENGG